MGKQFLNRLIVYCAIISALLLLVDSVEQDPSSLLGYMPTFFNQRAINRRSDPRNGYSPKGRIEIKTD
ncbi:unnamed protein product [Trichobilharzia szidati]|nr:unnamed protein product [Trichobilharzia szidati]